jgi:hypothetical protein
LRIENKIEQPWFAIDEGVYLFEKNSVVNAVYAVVVAAADVYCCYL